MRICVLTDGYLRFFFPDIYAYSPGKTLIILVSKSMKCKNAKSGAIMPMWRKTSQKAEISQTRIYLCFFEDTGIRYRCEKGGRLILTSHDVFLVDLNLNYNLFVLTVF